MELNTDILTIVGSILGLVWTYYGRKAILHIIESLSQKERYRIAFTSLEAGVEQAYQQYVREAKASSPNGKLGTEQEKEARRRAFALAQDIAMKQGIDLLPTLGKECIDVLIVKIVKSLKPSKVPQDVADDLAKEL